MGTYIIRPGQVQSKSIKMRGYNTSFAPGACDASDAALIEAALDTVGTKFVTLLRFCDAGDTAIGSHLIRFNATASDAVWYLDGSGVPVTFNSLAAGFTATSLPIVRADSINPTWFSNAANSFFLQFNSLTESASLNRLIQNQSFTWPSLQPSALSIMLNGMGLRYECVLGAADFIAFNDIRVTGSYDIIGFQWTISPVSGTSVDPGETITVTSDPTDPTALCLDELIQIELTGCGVITPIVQEKHLLIFTIPDGCSGTPDVEVTGNGTQFDGTIILGSFPVLAANGSGIYQFVSGKLNDTLYSGARDGTTFDVKIPNPFVKTGFIGG